MVAVVAGCCGSHMMKLWALICRMQNIADYRQQLIDEIQYVPIHVIGLQKMHMAK
jgi:hypothetical protein